MNRLKTEIDILCQHYHETKAYVSSDRFCTHYADEKIYHSMQVIGAGNYLIKHEKTFTNYTFDLLQAARRAYLFHDIGRFAEIRHIFDCRQNNRPETHFDHGVEGCRLLRTMPAYNSLLITLPIKHHGHLIKEFYQDNEYKTVSDELTRLRLEEIIFLVRDADKIANYYLLHRNRQEFENLFFAYNTSGGLTPEYLELFYLNQPLDCRLAQTSADRILNILAWIFDLNYRPSFEFLLKSGSFETMLSRLSAVNKNAKSQEKIAKTLRSFINKKLSV